MGGPNAPLGAELAIRANGNAPEQAELEMLL